MLWRVREFRKRHVMLTDWLCWAVLVAPGVILNKDGSLQKSYLYRGMDMDSSTEEELMIAVAQINNAFKRLGSNWCIYAEAQRVPSIAYPDRFYPDVVTTMIDAERRSFFSKGQLYESTYYLTLVYLPPQDKYDKFEKFLIESEENVLERERERLDEHLQSFLTETSRIHQLLREIMATCRPLTDDETLTYLHSTVSPKAHYIRTPRTGVFLDCLLADTPLTAGFSLYFGDKKTKSCTHMSILTVLGLPSWTSPGMLDKLNRLGFKYRWVTRFIPLSKDDANKEFENIRRIWFSKRKSLFTMLKESITRSESAMIDTDALQKFEDVQLAMRETGEDLVSYGYFTSTVVIMDENKQRLDEKTREVEKVINHEGFATICESFNCLDAWLGSIPGLARANIRRPIVNSINLAHMLPMSAVWAGPEKNRHLRAPVLMQTVCNGSTPFRLCLHQGDVGHTMVLGPTGSGKSVFLNCIAAQFRGYEAAQVYFFDIGASSRVLTAGVGGEFYDLSADSSLCFQPFANIDEEAERTWAQEWVEQLLIQEGVERITPELRREIWETLCRLANTPIEQRTVTGFYLMTQSKLLRDTMLSFMRPSHVTRGGAYGTLFDNSVDTLSYGAWQVFEMQTLMTQTSAITPALNYIFHKLEKNCTGKPTIFILDECWLFLDNPIFAAKIREWLKVMRKNNVSIIFATQNLQDVADSAIAPAIMESCPTRIFLPNPNALNANNKEIYNKFNLNDTERGILATAFPKRHYYYKSPVGSRLFELGLEEMPFSLAYLASSNKADQNKCKEILANYPNEFNRYWLEYKNLPEAHTIMENLLKEWQL